MTQGPRHGGLVMSGEAADLRDAVMAALVDEVPHHPDRLGTEAPAVIGGIEEQVDTRVAVLRVKLLVELDHPGDRAADLDHEACRLRVVAQRKVLPRLVPPARHLLLRQDAAQLGGVALSQQPQHHRRHAATRA
jgi:hypothetical protein